MTDNKKTQIEQMESVIFRYTCILNDLRVARCSIDYDLAQELYLADDEFKLEEKIDTLKKKLKQAKAQKKTTVRFLMHKVTDGHHTVKIDYSRDVETGAIKVYGATYAERLSKIFNDVIDNTDISTDYFEYERIVVTEDSPYWKQVNVQCKRREVKMSNQAAKRGAGRV